ncbi:uncharacterized protein [Periplaneta americana]|uniref:uncharacterized protein isoform X2 n=1 Tax=Periplaneta americana TaxID=6978 RepID=UPI0037E78C8D
MDAGRDSVSLRIPVIIVAIIGLVCSALLVAAFTTLLSLHEDSWTTWRLVAIVSSEVSLIFHSTLLYGACLRKPAQILPYIVVSLVILVAIALTVITAVLSGVYTITEFGNFLLPVSVMLFVLAVYLWLAVFNFYRQLVARPAAATGSRAQSCSFSDLCEIVSWRPRSEPETPNAELQNSRNLYIECTRGASANAMLLQLCSP